MSMHWILLTILVASTPIAPAQVPTTTSTPWHDFTTPPAVSLSQTAVDESNTWLLKVCVVCSDDIAIDLANRALAVCGLACVVAATPHCDEGCTIARLESSNPATSGASSYVYGRLGSVFSSPRRAAIVTVVADNDGGAALVAAVKAGDLDVSGVRPTIALLPAGSGRPLAAPAPLAPPSSSASPTSVVVGIVAAVVCGVCCFCLCLGLAVFLCYTARLRRMKTPRQKPAASPMENIPPLQATTSRGMAPLAPPASSHSSTPPAPRTCTRPRQPSIISAVSAVSSPPQRPAAIGWHRPSAASVASIAVERDCYVPSPPPPPGVFRCSFTQPSAAALHPPCTTIDIDTHLLPDNSSTIRRN
eukprot:TRINITY_DN13883_c0_g1_i1.p1 TRINITY_DN13883_c0_g1~~TRINITY_DN13883_c0_g1_i1.p1  ORF type:complete len:368 (+),score=17.60 TRINITY_DN13883_c0_g1_i1:25-1104(+)